MQEFGDQRAAPYTKSLDVMGVIPLALGRLFLLCRVEDTAQRLSRKDPTFFLVSAGEPTRWLGRGAAVFMIARKKPFRERNRGIRRVSLI